MRDSLNFCLSTALLAKFSTYFKKVAQPEKSRMMSSQIFSAATFYFSKFDIKKTFNFGYIASDDCSPS